MLDQILPDLIRCTVTLISIKFKEISLSESSILVTIIRRKKFVNTLVFFEIGHLFHALKVIDLGYCLRQEFHTILLSHITRFRVIFIITKAFSWKRKTVEPLPKNVLNLPYELASLRVNQRHFSIHLWLLDNTDLLVIFEFKIYETLAEMIDSDLRFLSITLKFDLQWTPINLLCQSVKKLPYCGLTVYIHHNVFWCLVGSYKICD